MEAIADIPRTERRTERQKSVLAWWFGRLSEALKLSNLCSHDPTGRFSFMRMELVFKVAVAVAPTAAGAFGPTVHPARVGTTLHRHAREPGHGSVGVTSHAGVAPNPS